MSVEFHESNGIYSHVVISKGLMFISGQVSTDSDNITEQSKNVLQKIENLLAKYGSDKKHLVNAVVYLKDISQSADFNAVWKDWVVAGCEPSRACIEANAVRPEILVEVSAVAEVIE